MATDYKRKTEEIKKFMGSLHYDFKEKNIFPSDKEITILGQAFLQRDKSDGIDVEMLHVIRGFIWGMKCMRQILEGHDLPPKIEH